jgi:hypothetical protein
MSSRIEVRLEPENCGPISIRDSETGTLVVTLNTGRDGGGNLCLSIDIADETRLCVQRLDGKALPKPVHKVW